MFSLSYRGFIALFLLSCIAVAGFFGVVRFVGQICCGSKSQPAVPQAAMTQAAPIRRGGGSFRTVMSILLGLALMLSVIMLPALFWVKSARTQTVRSGAKFSRKNSVSTSRALAESPTFNPAMAKDNPQLLSQMYSGGEVDSKAATLTSMPAEAPLGPPTWVEAANVVKSEPRASAKSAREEAVAQATELLMTQYIDGNRGVGNWKADIQQLDFNAITREYTEQIPWDFSAGTDFKSKEVLPDTAYRTYMQVNTDREVHSAIYQQWKRQVSDGRLEGVLFVFGGLTAAIALLATYLRIEKRGFLRRSARFASLMAAIGLGLGSTIAGAEAFTQQNHTGPAVSPTSGVPRHVQDRVALDRLSDRMDRVTSHRGHSNASTFAGIPVEARRVGFLVLGDRRFTEGDKIDRVAKEIARCVEGFGGVEYRVFCESNLGVKLTGTNRKIKQTLEKCFSSEAKAVQPRNAIHSLSSFSPDQVVLIRDADTELDSESDLKALVNALRGISVPINIVELDEGRTAERAELAKLAARSGGQCTVWPGEPR